MHKHWMASYIAPNGQAGELSIDTAESHAFPISHFFFDEVKRLLIAQKKMPPNAILLALFPMADSARAPTIEGACIRFK
jgi:hypothetical protein